MRKSSSMFKRRRPARGRRRIGVAALLGLGGAALLANRDRLRGVRRRGPESSTDEPIFTSVGMASSTGPADPPASRDEEASGAAPSSETPGTTAPPL